MRVFQLFLHGKSTHERRNQLCFPASIGHPFFFKGYQFLIEGPVRFAASLCRLQLLKLHLKKLDPGINAECSSGILLREFPPRFHLFLTLILTPVAVVEPFVGKDGFSGITILKKGLKRIKFLQDPQYILPVTAHKIPEIAVQDSIHTVVQGRM